MRVYPCICVNRNSALPTLNILQTQTLSAAEYIQPSNTQLSPEEIFLTTHSSMLSTSASLARPGLTASPIAPALAAQLRDCLADFPNVELALVFGSVATGQARFDSDLDIAVAAQRALTSMEKQNIISALAACTGRPIDLIDLKTAGEPLVGQIVRHGVRILGSDRAYGNLISRHLLDRADFMPYRNRILAERRAAWIGK